MAKFKYNVKGVESGGLPGLPANNVYPGKITKAVIETPEGKDTRLVVTVKATGAKWAKHAPIIDYINLESEAAAWKVRQFLEALGIVTSRKEQGTFDSDELVGMTCSFRVREDHYNGEYRPKLGTWLKAVGEADDDEDEDEDTDESDTDDEADDDEADDDEAADYSEWDDDDLKAELEERELDVPTTGRGRAKKFDRAAAIEALETSDAEDEPEDEDEDEDGDGESYADWDLADLKAELKERGLRTTGKHEQLVKRLEDDDADSDEL